MNVRGIYFLPCVKAVFRVLCIRLHNPLHERQFSAELDVDETEFGAFDGASPVGIRGLTVDTS